jgi:hypothetical protein
MSRAVYASLFLLIYAGCQLPPEPVPLKPLPEDGLPQAYADLVNRARVQASAANEAFYVNKWSDLEDVARGLELTATHLNKAADVPARHKNLLATEVADLIKESKLLSDAAKAQDVKQANELLQRINFKVRELRAEE